MKENFAILGAYIEVGTSFNEGKMNRNKELRSEFEYKDDLYRVYGLAEDDSDYGRIVRESQKGMYKESTEAVKKILDLDYEG
jgi:hypothetical protein